MSVLPLLNYPETFIHEVIASKTLTILTSRWMSLSYYVKVLKNILVAEQHFFLMLLKLQFRFCFTYIEGPTMFVLVNHCFSSQQF